VSGVGDEALLCRKCLAEAPSKPLKASISGRASSGTPATGSSVGFVAAAYIDSIGQAFQRCQAEP